MASAPTVGGKFEILSKIREGGMGAVYLARHRVIDKLVVIKVMRPQIADAGAYRDRFLREGSHAFDLKHRNIAALHDVALAESGVLYMVMEFIDGLTVADLVRTCGVPPVSLATEIGLQGLAALSYLHRSSLVHRDIAPDNLMLTLSPSGQPIVKLIDLGIARRVDCEDSLTQDGSFLGKLQYCSPEQLRGEFRTSPIDARSDLFSYGLVLWELLAGPKLYPAASVEELVPLRMRPVSLPFDERDPGGRIPGPLRDLLLRALAFEPAARFQDADEFAAALSAAAPEAPDPVAESAYLDAARKARPVFSSSELSHSVSLQEIERVFGSTAGGAFPPLAGGGGAAVGGAAGKLGTLVEGDDVPRPPAGTVFEPPPEPVSVPSPPGGGRTALIGAVAVGILAAAAGVWWLTSGRSPTRPDEQPATPTQAAEPVATRRAEQGTPPPSPVSEQVPPGAPKGDARAGGVRDGATEGAVGGTRSLPPVPLPLCLTQRSDYRLEVTEEVPDGFSEVVPRGARIDGHRIKVLFQMTPERPLEEQGFTLEARLKQSGDQSLDVGSIELGAPGAGPGEGERVTGIGLPVSVDAGASLTVYRTSLVVRQGKTYARQLRVTEANDADAWIGTVSIGPCD